MGPAIGKTEKTRGTDLSPNLQCAFQWNWICMFQSLEIFQFKRAIFWIRLFIKVWTNKSLNCRRPKIDGCPGEIWDRPKVNIGPERFGRREERFSGKANKRKRWEDSGHLQPNALWLQLIPQTWSKWCSKCDHFLTSASARPPGLLLIGAVRLSQSKQWKYQLQTHLSSYLSLSLGSPEYRQEKNAKFFFWKRQFLKKTLREILAVVHQLLSTQHRMINSLLNVLILLISVPERNPRSLAILAGHSVSAKSAPVFLVDYAEGLLSTQHICCIWIWDSKCMCGSPSKVSLPVAR